MSARFHPYLCGRNAAEWLIDMTFPERLKELRIYRNLTQKEIADSIGMAPVAYQRYEYGTREPAYQKLIALADYFDVSLDYLVGRSDDPTRR